MKFLHEMIAKKRQAQADSADIEPVGSGDGSAFELPEMSAVSREASELRNSGVEASASIIPYRQREEGQASEDRTSEGLRIDEAGYDWDVSAIDLQSAGDTANGQGQGAEAAAQLAASAVGEEFEEEMEPDVPMSGPMSTAPARPLTDDDFDPGSEQSEDEPEIAASRQVAANGSTGSNVTRVEMLEAAPEEAEGATALDSDEFDASDDADIAASGFRVPETPDDSTPRNAGEAAKMLRAQFQQRKIWDLEPAPAPEADADQVTDQDAEETAETVAEPEMPTAPVEPSHGMEQDEPEAVEAAPEATVEPAVTVPDVEDVAPLPVADEDDDLPPEQPNRRRAGRVKTRLLGFHKPESSVDPITAASQAPKTEANFPVGWLVVLQGPGRGASFTLLAGASKIGRGEDQTVRLDFGDTSISRDNHAVVAYDEEQRRFFIGHGGKANLVRLNDMPVLSTESLENGDTIRIGETTLLFVALCGPEFSWEESQESTDANAH